VSTSFDKESLNITICNLHPGLELISPVHCSKNAICCVSPNQQTNTDNIVEASFGIVSNQKDVKGALLYKLRRKYVNGTNNQTNSNIASIENAATNVYLLVAWNIENGCDNFRICLIECADGFSWDEDKLWTLRHQYNDQFFKNYNYITSTWLMHDGVVMGTKYKVTYRSDYKLSIFISEEPRKYIMRRPMKINPKRLVLLLLMLIVLMHAVSLSIQPSFKLDIHNRCSNIDLVTPMYVTGDGLECYRTPGYKVYTSDIMRSSFIIKSNNKSYGVIIYRLQRRQKHESAEISKDTSSDIYLLVVWRISESNELYANVLMIEHIKTLIWNEDNLNKLYRENHDRLKKCTDTMSDTWFMDNNVALKTTFSTSDLKGNHELSISISEERDEYAIKPFCIDLTR
jgi:hypothetical protein